MLAMYQKRLSLLVRPGMFAVSGLMLHKSYCVAKPEHNPLLDQQALPKFSQIKPVHVEPAISYCLAEAKEGFAKLEQSLVKADKKVTYAQAVEDIEKLHAPLYYSWGVVSHLMGVKNSPELRSAHDAMQPGIIEAGQRVGQSQPLYHALTSLRNNATLWKSLDAAQQRIIESSLRSMRNNGVGLQGAVKDEFNALQLNLSECSNRFSNNVLDSIKEYSLLVTDAADIDGLPSSAKELLSQQAVNAGHTASTPESGPWLITLDIPSFQPCMQHLKNRSIREKLYRAYVTRASSGTFDNTQNINDILTMKKRKAEILGYKNYAELSLSSKMVPSIDTVNNLLSMLREKSLPFAQEEHQSLRDFASKSGFTGELALWDTSFWSERLREAKYEYREEELRPYFALPNVLDGLFSLAERLFNIKIEAADGTTDVWHPDVRFFKIVDKTSQTHIASFYLDPYSRPADKRGGAWMDVCVGRSKVMKRIPVAYLTCNGSPPVKNKPSLMTFREVETLFHEFGHGLQHMLTTVEHADAAGISNVEWDAVELPSQFMENWCYDRKTLFGFAKHFETGAPLPEEYYQKILASKNFLSGMAMLRQLYFACLDMTLHSVYDPASGKSPYEVQQEVAKLYTVLAPLPDDRFLCSFSHIFAGGYAAGYYSYKWAEVMSADAFAAFEEAGLDNEQAVRETGKRFRDTVLSLGGGTHPSEVFRAFRGKDPSPEALLRHSGLVDKR